MVLPYAAHAAPMQLLFHTGASFPAEYRGDALVTMRGSWNRGTVRAGGLAEGKPTTLKPFVSAFVSADGKAHFARPMSLAQIADGALLMADDANGVVYRFAYVAPSERGGVLRRKVQCAQQEPARHTGVPRVVPHIESSRARRPYARHPAGAHTIVRRRAHPQGDRQRENR